MEILTQPVNTTKYDRESLFDKKSRQNYFEMLKVALENLSIVYEKDSERNVFVQK
jgi:hypothetical protein